MRRWYLLALTLLVWIPSVDAGDIYVSDAEGDDVLHDGSSPTIQGGGVGPFKTIGKALQGAGAGDTVHLRTGTYLEAVFVTATAAAATPLTIQNYNGELVGINSGTTNPFLILNASGIVIDGVRVEHKVGATSLLVSGSSDVVLRNMTVSGSASSDTGAAVTVIDSSSVTVEDCVFSDNLDPSLQLVNVGSYEVSGSDFSGSRATSTLSVSGTSGTGLIDDNDFVDNWGTGGGGFNVLSISQAAAGHTVSNNRLSSTVVPADVYDFANAISVFLTNGVALNGNSVTGFSFNATGGGFTGNGISINGVSGTPVDGTSIATAGITGGGGLSLQLSFAQNTTVADLSSDQKAQVQSATTCAFVRPVFQNVTDGPTLFLND